MFRLQPVDKANFQKKIELQNRVFTRPRKHPQLKIISKNLQYVKQIQLYPNFKMKTVRPLTFIVYVDGSYSE